MANKKQEHMSAINDLMRNDGGDKGPQNVDEFEFNIGSVPAPQKDDKKEPKKPAHTSEKLNRQQRNYEPGFIGIRMDEEIVGKLRALSAETNFSMSELARQAIESSLKNYEKEHGQIAPMPRPEQKTKPDKPIL